jgi:hypothetical protein
MILGTVLHSCVGSNCLLLKSILLKVQMSASVIQLKRAIEKMWHGKVHRQDDTVHGNLCPRLQHHMQVNYI